MSTQLTTPAPVPADRPLRVFAFDPSRGTAPTNIVILRVPYERLQKGPVGRYVAIIDQDQTLQRTYEGVDLETLDALRHGGLTPSELDFGFHQQMAYAVISRTIQAFEQALGREIRWPWARADDADAIENRLRVYPHAIQDPTAYYHEGALYFGYFKGEQGTGQVMYTGLSYDLVAHEAVHPLVHAVFPNSRNVALNPGAAAFEEGFATLIALLQHFDFEDALLDAIVRTNGRIWRLITAPDIASASTETLIQAERPGTNPLLELGHQFGHALGLGSSLMTALGSPPDQASFEATDEPHKRGASLVAAVFDALFTVYVRRVRDLLGSDSGDEEGALHPDLHGRLASAASRTARQFMRMCIRALDYCPPVNIHIGEYLRALVTSDAELIPIDEWRFRDAVIESFRLRGIEAEGVLAHSEEGLRWPQTDPSLPACPGLRFTEAAAGKNAELLEAYADANRAALELAPDVPLTIDPLSVHGSQRVAPNGELLREIVAQVTQMRNSHVGGTTIVLDETGVPKYVVAKPLGQETTSSGDVQSDEDPTRPSRQPRRGPSERRPLKIFAFDPAQGRRFGNHLTVSIPYEPLSKGPIGRQIAVVDYDASNACYYDAVDLEGLGVVLGGGIDPSDTDPRFHQQMVYAVAMAAIERFELGLGRPVVWRWEQTTTPFSGKLLIHPHAMHEANAFYDRDLHALLFGYFSASEEDYGPNLPGQIVYTCLSHDIVVHETTHAILDSVHRYLLERTSPDAPAFHEAYADIMALLQHFSFPEALRETIQRSGGRIHQSELAGTTTRAGTTGFIGAEATQSNPLVELARQFGEALGNRSALRSALGTPRDKRALIDVTEAHARGAILVAAVFDAFFSVYVQRTADLMRVARSSGTITPAEDLHPELAVRLAREATDTAQRFALMCVRSLDYLPPVDVEFGDFLRALVTADSEAEPRDALGYRAALIDAFTARGIYPQDVSSLSEEALAWDRADVTPNVRCNGLDPDLTQSDVAQRNAIILGRFARKYANELGLSNAANIRIQSMRSVASRRVDPHGIVRPEFHVQIGQVREELIDPEIASSQTFKFRGGATVILNENGGVEYVIGKNVDNPDRLRRQQRYLQQLLGLAPSAAYQPEGLVPLNVAALHRGLEE